MNTELSPLSPLVKVSNNWGTLHRAFRLLVPIFFRALFFCRAENSVPFFGRIFYKGAAFFDIFVRRGVLVPRLIKYIDCSGKISLHENVVPDPEIHEIVIAPVEFRVLHRLENDDALLLSDNSDVRQLSEAERASVLDRAFHRRLRAHRVRPELLVDSLKARGKVHAVAEHRVVEPVIASHVSDYGSSRIQPDSLLERFSRDRGKLLLHLRELLLAFEGGLDGAPRVVGLRRRRVPECDYRVALVFVDCPAVLEDDFRHRVEVLVEEVRQIGRVQALGNRGETLDVGEERRNLALLPAELERVRIVDEVVDDFRRKILLERRLEIPLLLSFRKIVLRHDRCERKAEREERGGDGKYRSRDENGV